VNGAEVCHPTEISMHIRSICLWCAAVLIVMPGVRADPGADAAVPARSLTLEEAVRRALDANPEYAAGRARILAAEGAAETVGAFSNPEFRVEVENFGGDFPRWRGSESTYAVAQALEAPGKRGARLRAAGHAAEAERLSAEAERLDLVARVKGAFLHVLGAQEHLRLSGEGLRTAEELREAVDGLVEAGEVSPIERSRADGELAMAGVDLLRAEQGLSEARRSLSMLWGAEVPDFGRVEGTLDEVPPPADAESIRRSLEGLPDLAMRREEVSRRREALQLARRERLPDVTLTFGRREFAETGEHAYVAGIALPLPLWNRNRGRIVEVSALQDEAVLDLRAAEVRLRVRLENALEASDRCRAEVAALRETLLPEMRRVFEAVREGYERGKFPLVDLLMSRGSLIEAEGRYVEALVRLGHARIELERLGGPAGPAVPGGDR